MSALSKHLICRVIEIYFNLDIIVAIVRIDNNLKYIASITSKAISNQAPYRGQLPLVEEPF